MPKAERTVTIGSRVGLHARPASLFVQAVAATGHDVTITKSNGDDADAASILSVLALGVGHGDELSLVAQMPVCLRMRQQRAGFGLLAKSQRFAQQKKLHYKGYFQFEPLL